VSANHLSDIDADRFPPPHSGHYKYQ